MHFGLGSKTRDPISGQPVNQSQLWVDIDGPSGPAILSVFRPFFEEARYCKVWHNYGFDRHVLENAGLRLGGFAGDTMHMARLLDAGRKGKGYSLEALTSDRDVMMNTKPKAKVSMKELFARPVPRKDGSDGKTKVLPPMEVIQNDPGSRPLWIKYAAGDALSTWQLYQVRASEPYPWMYFLVYTGSQGMMSI